MSSPRPVGRATRLGAAVSLLLLGLFLAPWAAAQATERAQPAGGASLAAGSGPACPGVALRGAARSSEEWEHRNDRTLRVALPRVALWLVLLAVAGVLVVRARRGLAPAPTPGASASPPRGYLVATLALAAVAAAIRLPLVYLAGPESYENVPLAHGLSALPGFFVPESATYPHSWGWLVHPPLQPAFAVLWSRLGELFGWGGEYAWLRLPNVGLSALVVVLLARVGWALFLPAAGLAAGTLFAFLPAVLRLGVIQESYLLEAALVTWFLERLSAVLVFRRPALAGLALSGGLALLAGPMTAPIVALGVALVGVRGAKVRRPWPFIVLALFVVVAGTPSALGALLVAPWYALGKAASASGVTGLQWYGTLPAHAYVPLFGLLALVVARFRLAVPVLLVLLAYFGLASVSLVRLANLACLLPVVLFAPVAGVEALLVRPYLRWVPWVGVFAATAAALIGAWIVVPPSDGVVATVLFSRQEPGSFADVRPLADALAEDVPPCAPLLLVGSPYAPHQVVCTGHASLEEALACVQEPMVSLAAAGIEGFPTRSRWLALARSNAHDGLSPALNAAPPPAPAFSDLARQAPWRATPFVVAWSLETPAAWFPAAFDAFRAARLACEPLPARRMAGHLLFRCRPAN